MKRMSLCFSLIALPLIVSAQSVTEAYSISQQDLRGTARYMSMAGAFGALGGDLSSISQNPGGIGVYRSSEIGLTLDLDIMNNKSTSGDFSSSVDKTKFYLNNIGAVFAINLRNSTMPYLNLGFTYNKGASFSRSYSGSIPNLKTSMSNYIAGISNSYGLTEADVSYGDGYDPYNPPINNRTVPWLAVLGYYGFLTNPEGNPDNPNWQGQFGNGTSGKGYFKVNEKGSLDEYNIAIGGNINNVVFWGMDFDITSIFYRIESNWGESLENAYVYNPNTESVGRYQAKWNLNDNYQLQGTGFCYKLGVIVKPIQELRLGFAFHTPTLYTLDETYYDAHIDYKYTFPTNDNSTWANDGYSSTNRFNFNTPWRIIASAAGVVGSKFIISADYQWEGYKHMKYSDASNYSSWSDPWNYWDDPWNDWTDWYGAPRQKSNASTRSDYYYSANEYANAKIKEVYKDTHTIRIGAEYRVIPCFSIRAGYSFSSSPVTSKAKNYEVDVPGTGLMSNYRLDDYTNHVTFGLGYKNKAFYADLAYVYKHTSSEYFPFSPDIYNPSSAVKSNISFDTSRIALSVGYKF